MNKNSKFPQRKVFKLGKIIFQKFLNFQEIRLGINFIYIRAQIGVVAALQ